MKRCPWANSPLEKVYHDTEWGKPSFDDEYLFELLILEGKQAGLSWQTILNKREDLRECLDNFNWRVIKDYTDEKLESLLLDKRLIRHRLKVYALRKNAIVFEKVRQEFGTFSHYIWGFVECEPIINHWTKMSDVPTQTVLSDTISKDLKKRGFSFVGSTIIYSYLQAIGIVNDHLEHCAFK